MTTKEQKRHNEVAHQERYQINKQKRLSASHKRGNHKNALVTCNLCQWESQGIILKKEEKK